MKLYEITGNMAALENMLEDETLTDEDTRQAITDTLESLEGDLEEKAENIVKLIRNLQAEAESCKQEAERFAKRAKTCEIKVKSLKQYLTGAMQTTGREKMKAGLFNLTLRASGQRAIAYKVKAEELPSRFRKTEKVVKVNTEAVREWLKAGHTSKYFELAPAAISLLIK